MWTGKALERWLDRRSHLKKTRDIWEMSGDGEVGVGRQEYEEACRLGGERWGRNIQEDKRVSVEEAERAGRGLGLFGFVFLLFLVCQRKTPGSVWSQKPMEIWEILSPGNTEGSGVA